MEPAERGGAGERRSAASTQPACRR
uniref:Uncharacterized protein n=1 Tax=Triticum urartu TaxID=4572 RepID=A0A8R7P5X5_TRIUA